MKLRNEEKGSWLLNNDLEVLALDAEVNVKVGRKTQTVNEVEK